MRQQFACIMARFNLKLCSTDSNTHDSYIRQAMLAGYFMQVVHLDQTGQYVIVKDNKVYVLVESFAAHLFLLSALSHIQCLW